jgi:hypothetical protein
LYPEGVAHDVTMSWDAIDALDDARAATQSLLLPVSWRTWLRLTLVTAFVGGVGGGGGAGQAAQGAASSPTPRVPGPVLPGVGPADLAGSGVDLPPVSPLAPESLAALALVGGLVVVVVAGYALVGAVMAFVLVECLRTRRVELRRPVRQFLAPGGRLFLFRAAVGLALVGLGLLPLLVGLGLLSVPPAGVLVVPALAGVAAVAWVVGLVGLRLTTDFVVPTMIAEGRGVLSAWRRVVPLLRAEWREVALYLVLRLALGVAASLVVGLVVGLAALVAAVPFVLVGLAVVVGVGVQGAGLVALGGLAAVFVLVVLAVGVVVQVPVVTYFRYYGLFLLGTFDDRLDLVGRHPTTGTRRVNGTGM